MEGDSPSPIQIWDAKKIIFFKSVPSGLILKLNFIFHHCFAKNLHFTICHFCLLRHCTRRWQGHDLWTPVTPVTTLWVLSHRKTGQKPLSEPAPAPPYTRHAMLCKNRGMGDKTSNEAKNNLDWDLAGTNGGKSKEMWITRVQDVAMIRSEPCPGHPWASSVHLSSHTWHNSPSYILTTLPQCREPRTHFISCVNLCEKAMAPRLCMNNFLFVRLFHFPSFTGSSDWPKEIYKGESKVDQPSFV